MTLNEFEEEFDSLSKIRQEIGLKKLFDKYLSDIEKHQDELAYIIDRAVMLEQDDYFGTEGLHV